MCYKKALDILFTKIFVYEEEERIYGLILKLKMSLIQK